MKGFQLRTKFLLSMLLVSLALTGTTLLVVRRTVQEEARREIQRDLKNSVLTFQGFQRHRSFLWSVSISVRQVRTSESREHRAQKCSCLLQF